MANSTDLKNTLQAATPPESHADELDLGHQDLSELRELSHKKSLGLFRVLRLPKHLEQAFRADYRKKATEIVKYSVYGLIGLYLLVVIPIALLIQDPMQALWRHYAVYPIGVALLIIWTSTQFDKLSKYTELTLRFGVFLSLLGTIYSFMVLGDTLLGLVAGCETIYVLIVAFSMLMLRIFDVLRSAISAFVLAMLIAACMKLDIRWVGTFLYFWVPLLICVVTGYLLEYAARRNFIHNLVHQQDRLRMVNDMAALISDVDDMDTVLSMALERVCVHAGWLAGRVSTFSVTEQSVFVHHSYLGLVDSMELSIGQVWHPSSTSLIRQVTTSGKAYWQNYYKNLGLGVQGQSHAVQTYLIFPVKLDNRVLAIMEFLSEQQEQPDHRLLSLMDNIGSQLGRVFERTHQQQELKVRAMHDALTGLPNRTYLFDRLKTDIARAKRNSAYTFCVLFVDADRFKWVNDSLGHLIGDRLLIDLCKRLQQSIRAVDFVARVGGDEFAIVIDEVSDDSLMIVIERIRKQLERPFIIDDQDIYVGLSIGVVMYDSDYTEPEDLLRDADIAMYHAKQTKRGSYAIFTLEMRKQVVERLKLVAELREAIEAQQFILHYQPIVDANSHMIVGFEALIRWQHPERGLLSPIHFISLAEETGLITQMTEWVLREVCQQLNIWQHHAGDRTTSISVNLCASYLIQPEMPDQILAIAKAADIDPKTLRLEITETQIVTNAEICMDNIHRLRDMSFAVYIDDFGTGYSSLNYLANFKVSALKIDKSFLKGLGSGGKESHIVQIIISLGHHLGLTVIAEGVETEEQRQHLELMGCDLFQGYLFSEPVNIQTASKLVDQQKHGHVLFPKNNAVAMTEE